MAAAAGQDDDEDDEGAGLDGLELKKFIKKARSKALPFAFVPPAGQEDPRVILKMRGNPRKLSDELRNPPSGGDDDDDGAKKKKGKKASKFVFGFARVDGKTMKLTIKKDMPGLKKKFEKMLREAKIKMTVEPKVTPNGAPEEQE